MNHRHLAAAVKLAAYDPNNPMVLPVTNPETGEVEYVDNPNYVDDRNVFERRGGLVGMGEDFRSKAVDYAKGTAGLANSFLNPASYIPWMGGMLNRGVNDLRANWDHYKDIANSVLTGDAVTTQRKVFHRDPNVSPDTYDVRWFDNDVLNGMTAPVQGVVQDTANAWGSFNDSARERVSLKDPTNPEASGRWAPVGSDPFRKQRQPVRRSPYQPPKIDLTAAPKPPAMRTEGGIPKSSALKAANILGQLGGRLFSGADLGRIAGGSAPSTTWSEFMSQLPGKTFDVFTGRERFGELPFFGVSGGQAGTVTALPFFKTYLAAAAGIPLVGGLFKSEGDPDRYLHRVGTRVGDQMRTSSSAWDYVSRIPGLSLFAPQASAIAGLTGPFAHNQ